MPMDIEIRPIVAEEFEAYAKAVDRSFGEHPRPESVENDRTVFEVDRSLAALDGGTIIGSAAAFSFQVTVPGGILPMAAITAVGVLPTHRRRGVLTSMMRRQLGDVREAGEPLAGLWASEGAIYQRFGYGLAALATDVVIERRLTAYARPYTWPGSVRLIEKDEALRLFPPVFDRVLARTPGMWGRSPAFWKHDYADFEHRRDGASALFYGVYESAAGPEGYLTYRVKHDWSEGMARGLLRVRELVTDTPEAYAALWRFAFDHDLIGKIEAWPRRIDEPLLHMLAHPQALNLRIGDGLWLRVVDVAGALEGRRYRREGRVVLEVRDDFCPWNEGRYELVAGPEGASCRRTGRTPQLVLDAADLAAVYLGGTRFQNLREAGRASDSDRDALVRADGLFGWDPQPFCSHVF